MCLAIRRHWREIWKALKGRGMGLRRGWCLIAFVILSTRRGLYCSQKHRLNKLKSTLNKGILRVWGKTQALFFDKESRLSAWRLFCVTRIVILIKNLVWYFLIENTYMSVLFWMNLRWFLWSHFLFWLQSSLGCKMLIMIRRHH